MKNISLFIILLLSLISTAQDLPKVKYGTIERIESFKTDFVEPRNIDIWLPENYDISKQYSVVYMHDGQMLFDSDITWNKTAWDADDTFGILLENGEIHDCIIVGIWNVPETFCGLFSAKDNR